MKGSLAVVVAIVGCLFNIVNADEAVHTLTEKNFDAFIAENPKVLAKFYAPWCGHCKKLAPEYEAAAKSLAAEHPEIKLAKIDVTVEKSIGERFGIQGYPTLKWIVNGDAKEYTGGRTESTIVQWIKKKVGPAAKKLSSAAELTAFKDSADVVVVGVFAEEGAESKAFESVAAESEDAPFAIVIGAPIGDVKAGITLFKKFDDGVAVYSGDLKDTSAIEKFVAGNSLPLVTPFSQETAQKIFGGSIKQHCLVFVDKTDEATTKATVDAAAAVAKEYVGEYLFVSVDKTDSRILEFFGVKEGDIPTARIVLLGEAGMKKYKIEGTGASKDAISAFVAKHKKGELQLDLKSEEIPASQDEDVFVLVAKQFDEIIKGGKNVLVEFYAPWCGHCKQLEPIYKELAAKYKKADNLIIAKFDGTANEVESVQIQGFPTIKFYPAGGEVEDYEGGRDLESLSKFLEEKVPGLKA